MGAHLCRFARFEKITEQHCPTMTIELDAHFVELFYRQIALEYRAHFEYRQLATIMGSQSVALPGLEKLFKKESDEELSHADMFIDKLKRRGVEFVFKNCNINSSLITSDISQHDLVNLGPGLAGFAKTATPLEESVYENLSEIKKHAEKNPRLGHFCMD